MARGTRMRVGRRFAAAVALAALLAIPAAGRAEDDAAFLHGKGRAALAEGDRDRARHFLLRAYALRPGSAAIAGDLVLAAGGDPDARTLWAQHLAAAGVDPKKGRFTLPRDWPKGPRGDLTEAAEIARLRVKAAQACGKAALRLKGATESAQLGYLRSLLGVVTAGAPQVREAEADAFEKAARQVAADRSGVLGALADLMRKASLAGDHATALEAARILRGISKQREEGKSKGDRPSDDEVEAAEFLRRSRAALHVADEDVPKVEDLRRVLWDEYPQWSEDHASWANPGRTFSPEGRYRIETTCGYETLMAVAEEIEFHHDRLVRWFGVDPFLKTPGLVRLVHSYADFEGEGLPFWWAAGFQSGNTTVIRVHHTDSEGLGGTLTHELTHRFDRVLYPGIPAWLAEGRAKYTETCSPSRTAEAIDERVINLYPAFETYSKGYGRPEELKKLLEGKIDDYRDNYPAGYTLILFLMRFRGFDAEQAGPHLFRARFQEFMDGFKGMRPAPVVKRFAQLFCDGKAGRPADFADFCAVFERFCVEGGRGWPVAPWRAKWEMEDQQAFAGARREKPRAIFDHRTRTRSRSRFDPPQKGEEQAYLAAELLARVGRKDAAIEAYGWAQDVDEPSADRFVRVADYLAEQGKAADAWALRMRAHRMQPHTVGRPEGTAGDASAGAWRAAHALAKRLAALVAKYEEEGRPRVARALRSDHDQVARWLGIDLFGEPAGASAPRPEQEPTGPDCRPYVSILRGKLKETRWGPLDSKEGGAWHQPTENELELGRRKSKAVRTGPIRDAGIRYLYVRGDEHFQGTYTLRTTVRFRSAYADAQVVLGNPKPGRGIIVRFHGGDWQYATGMVEDSYPLDFVHVHIDDLRPFDAAVSATHSVHHFDTPRRAFQLAVHVCGPFVRVEIEGRQVLSLRRATNDPVEGPIGFGLRRGVVGFADAAVRSHRVLGPEEACGCDRFDAPLALDRPNTFAWRGAQGRRVEGLPVEPGGTQLLWYTRASPPAQRDDLPITRALSALRQPFEREHLPASFHVAVPGPAVLGEKATQFPTGRALDLPPERYHRHGGHADLCERLKDELGRFVNRWRARGAPEDVATRAAQDDLFGRPVRITLDADGTIRSCGPGDVEGYALNLVRILHGW